MDVFSFLTRRDLLLEVKCRSYSAFVYSVTLCGSETWPFKEDDVIRVEKNDAMTFRLQCNIRSEEIISALERWNRLELNTVGECFQNRRLRLFVHLEKLEEISQPSSNCQKREVGSSIASAQLRKKQSEVMKGIWKNEKSTRDRNAWKSFTRPGLKAKRTKVVMTVMCVLWIINCQCHH